MALMLEEATTTPAIVAIVLALNPLTHHLLHSPPILGARNRLHASKVVPVLGAFGPKSLTFNSSGEGPCTGVINGRVLNGEATSVGGSTSPSLPLRERGDTAASSDRDDARPTASLVALLESEMTASLQLQTNGFTAIAFSLRDGEDKQMPKTKDAIKGSRWKLMMRGSK